jgi:biopolymer transport protein ExbB/biopolymer transport protein TolQ
MNIVDTLLNIALLGSSWVLWLLLSLSVLSMGLTIERVIYFYRKGQSGGDDLRVKLLKQLNSGDLSGAEKLLRDSKTVDGSAVADAFPFRAGGARAFGDALESEVARRRKDLESGLNFLGTLGSNAPFIGLFGTVIGVIVAFHELGSAAAKAGAMGGVMSGIAESLVATAVGLFVAIPAVVAYNVAQKRIGDIEQDTLALGKLVQAWIEMNAHQNPAVEK